MSVRDVSARTPAGIREESARSPLYPTRPDPTRPFKDLPPSLSIHSSSYVTRERATAKPSDHRPATQPTPPRRMDGDSTMTTPATEAPTPTLDLDAIEQRARADAIAEKTVTAEQWLDAILNALKAHDVEAAASLIGTMATHGYPHEAELLRRRLIRGLHARRATR